MSIATTPNSTPTATARRTARFQPVVRIATITQAETAAVHTRATIAVAVTEAS